MRQGSEMLKEVTCILCGSLFRVLNFSLWTVGREVGRDSEYQYDL